MRRCCKCGVKKYDDNLLCPECEYKIIQNTTKKQEQIPNRATGRWILQKPTGVWTHIYMCSNCEARVISCEVDLPRYCGMCGAEMGV